MIGQNRQAAFQQAKADHEFAEEEQELKLNTELTREIRELTREVHERVVGTPSTGADEKLGTRTGRQPRLQDPDKVGRPTASRLLPPRAGRAAPSLSPRSRSACSPSTTSAA